MTQEGRTTQVELRPPGHAPRRKENIVTAKEARETAVSYNKAKKEEENRMYAACPETQKELNSILSKIEEASKKGLLEIKSNMGNAEESRDFYIREQLIKLGFDTRFHPFDELQYTISW